jgi:hypothetical protein
LPKERAVSRKGTLVLCITSALVNALGARVLDGLGLIEGLLSPAGWRLLLIVPLSLAFYGARLFVYFIAPGLLLAELYGLLRSPRAATLLQKIYYFARDSKSGSATNMRGESPP